MIPPAFQSLVADDVGVTDRAGVEAHRHRLATPIFGSGKRDESTQAFLASLVESSDDSIIGTTLEGVIVSWNAGAERLFGYTAQEVIGKPILILFPPDRQTDYLTTLGHVRRRERIERFESVRLRKDGVPIDVSVILSPVKNAAGEFLGVSAVYRDITGAKRVAAELLQAKEAAEAANRAKSEFLANMSHEIRTPMNGIMGMLDVVLDSPLDPDQEDCLKIARSSAGALLAILNDILDFSKIEAGRMDLEATPMCLTELIEETAGTLDIMASRKGLELRRTVANGLPPMVLGDPVRLRQVLLNLVNNAIKFTAHGFVEIQAGVQRLDSTEAVVRFAVVDSGIGIPPAQREVIFEAFRQADGSTTRRYGGTGLGLSICQRLVALMGGELRVESQPNEGSTFSFTTSFPLP